MEIYHIIVDNIWSTKIWLPPNTTWDDIAPGSRPDINHANSKDLIWPLFLAIFMLLLRYTLER